MTSPLGEFETAVLMAVAHLGNEGYGTTVRTEIERRTARAVSRGAVYITLERLETKGLLRSKLGPSIPQRGGRPRRGYALTAGGEAALRASVTAFADMLAGLSLNPQGRRR